MKGKFAFVYPVGRHVVRVTGNDGRWSVDVDGVGVDGSFASKADAWAAGVAMIDRTGSLKVSAAEASAG